LPEVFPDFAPGSFSWDDELAGWVWTTFNSWQWDLNWHEPDVLCEFAELICFLANAGVECLRLDAIAFLWKRSAPTARTSPRCTR
jgi:amylosucrase